MELEINTTHKLIKVKGQVNIKELMAFLNKILPDFEYEEWSITEYPQMSWANSGVSTINIPGIDPGAWPITTGSPVTMISGNSGNSGSVI